MEENKSKNEYNLDELLEFFGSNRDEIFAIAIKILDATKGYSVESAYVACMEVAYCLLGLYSFDEEETKIYKLAAIGHAKSELDGIAKYDSIEIAKYGFAESEEIENAIVHV